MQHSDDSLAVFQPAEQADALPEVSMFDAWYRETAPWTTEPADYQPYGIEGTLLPYRFRNDDLVTAAMLMSFLLITWVVAGSWRFIKNYSRKFFRPRERENLFADEGEGEIRGSLLLIMQSSFLISILYFSHLQSRLPLIFHGVQPYKILGTTVGVVMLYYMLKIGIYSLVNSVFFDRWQCNLWRQDYLMNVFALGVALSPLVLLVVYFDLDYTVMRGALLAILLLLKSLLFYRCTRIFFNTGNLGFHLFLYFCTLEIAPLLILWRILLLANNFLTTIY